MRWLLTILFLTTLVTHAQPSLDGREVFLVVTAERTDLDGEWLELTLRGMRNDLAIPAQDIPVVRMGFEDSDANAVYFERLELKAEDAPTLALVRWSENEDDGPEELLESLHNLRRQNGLASPRDFFIRWLEANNRDEEAAQLRPKPVPEPEPEDPAQVAFRQHRYPEAIELARQSQQTDLEEEARRAYEAQGALAALEKDKRLALAVFSRLHQLYPDNNLYKEQTKTLGRRPEEAIVGHWRLNSTLGWCEFESHSDGKLIGKAAAHLWPVVVKMEGHWEMTGANERTFELHWKNGNLHNVKVHEDLTSLEGRGLHEGDVTGRKKTETGWQRG